MPSPALSAGSPRGIKEGGTFRVGMVAGSVTTIDPALVSSGVELLAPACGTLMNYPAKPLPEGGRLQPELAEADPMISGGGRVYTFTIRRDARFSDGSRVTARAFVRAIERVLDPAMQAYARDDLAAALVGGEDVVAGRTKKPSGVSAIGKVLTMRLTKRIPDFLSSIEQLCAVSPSLPADPEGARAPLSSPAPYYVAQYVPGERLVLERNRFYRGQRPHHVDRFVADLRPDVGTIIDSIASGEFDFSSTINLGERASELRQRYGVNRSQLFVRPANELRMFVLNTSRPLFKNNPNLRSAVKRYDRVLALQVELCSPRLLASRTAARLAAFGLSAGVLAAGPGRPVYSSRLPDGRRQGAFCTCRPSSAPG